MIKVIIFDYDGVIVDSFPTVHKVYQIICEKLGKFCPSNFEEFRKVYGEGADEFSIKSGFSKEDINKRNIIYREEILKTNPPIFDGITEVIKRLGRKYYLVLISSSPREDVMKKLVHYKIDKIFKLIYAGDSTGPMKKTESIKQTMEKTKTTPNEIIIIGDRINDYKDAKEAGLSNILLVDYGWGYDKNKIPEYKPKAIVKKPLDILDAVKKF